ncbi:DUF5610 domain-containing protein [Neptuniibacter halophilus]|uniref:DUF5610 domain-containing protein n=1 Tax=Neptuniibacter halophilus TaxID=651666 RepID=UPI00257484F6|nr:DUF5610 domain-containing protein [Neptuniibacter halophilus]
MQVLLSSHTAYSQMRQDTLVSGGFADGKESGGNSASATDQMLSKLAENIPGMSLSEMKGLNADDYSPEKVASRIAGFVAQGLEQARSRGASDAELNRMYQDALSGVEKGFKEATEILDGLGALTPELNSTLEQTQDLTFEALAGLEPANQTAPARQTSIAAAERFSRAESFSMDVMTREGDKVSIRFSARASETASLGAYSDENGSAIAFGMERSASSNYSFSVKGDLNEEELDALTELMQDLSLIADDFYGGDIQDAFEQATELEMDKSQLMNLNVTMSQSMSYSAVAAYEQVQQMEQPLGNNGRHLGQLMNNFDRFASSPALGFLQNSTDFGADLLDNLIHQDIRYKDADEESQTRLDDNFGVLRDLMTRFDQDEADD